jgi:hypothetical protein
MRIFLFTGLLVVGLCHTAAAAELASHWWWPWASSQPPCPCCPDDYHAKPLPCVRPVTCGGPDDYHRKPLPHTCPVQCGGPDDYCRKPCPLPPPLCAPPWYTCGPAAPCATAPDGPPTKP